jgi:hypothetical protein
MIPMPIVQGAQLTLDARFHSLAIRQLEAAGLSMKRYWQLAHLMTIARLPQERHVCDLDFWRHRCSLLRLVSSIMIS